jgi:hypothetical protein
LWDYNFINIASEPSNSMKYGSSCLDKWYRFFHGDLTSKSTFCQSINPFQISELSPRVHIFKNIFLSFSKRQNKCFSFLRVSNTKNFNDIYGVCVYMHRDLKRQKTSLQVPFLTYLSYESSAAILGLTKCRVAS